MKQSIKNLSIKKYEIANKKYRKILLIKNFWNNINNCDEFQYVEIEPTEEIKKYKPIRTIRNLGDKNGW